MHLLFYISSSLIIVSQTAANINRTWCEGSTCDWTVQCWFLKFCSKDMSLESQDCVGCLSAIDTQHLKILLEQNSHLYVREMSRMIVMRNGSFMAGVFNQERIPLVSSGGTFSCFYLHNLEPKMSV